jgi:hypothetical protein
MGKTANTKQWIKANKRKLAFFIIFFFIFGTSSLWMSLIYLSIDIEDIIIGLLTISIAGVYSPAERALELMRTRKIEDNEDLIVLIAIATPIFISALVIGFVDKCLWLSGSLSIITYFLYCILWWYQNRDNKNLDGNFNTLAGSAEQFKEQ